MQEIRVYMACFALLALTTTTVEASGTPPETAKKKVSQNPPSKSKVEQEGKPGKSDSSTPDKKEDSKPGLKPVTKSKEEPQPGVDQGAAKVKPAPSDNAEKVRPAVNRRFVGQLSGDVTGTISFHLRGNQLSRGYATINGHTLGLRKTDKNPDGSYIIRGNDKSNHIRFSGAIRSGGRWTRGTFFGAVQSKRVRGAYTASTR